MTKRLKKPKPYELIKIGNPLLRERAKEVEDPKSPEIKEIADRMFATIEKEGGGAGLAAPQVGIMLRLFIFHIDDDVAERKKTDPVPWTIVINPKIEALVGEMTEAWEGCFCIPDYASKVQRYNEVIYTYFDLEGNHHRVKATGWHARAIQHETDHLDGILNVDRLKDLSNFVHLDELENLRKVANI